MGRDELGFAWKEWKAYLHEIGVRTIALDMRALFRLL
jgi:hypothetical protein